MMQTTIATFDKQTRKSIYSVVRGFKIDVSLFGTVSNGLAYQIGNVVYIHNLWSPPRFFAPALRDSLKGQV